MHTIYTLTHTHVYNAHNIHTHMHTHAHQYSHGILHTLEPLLCAIM